MEVAERAPLNSLASLLALSPSFAHKHSLPRPMPPRAKAAPKKGKKAAEAAAATDPAPEAGELIGARRRARAAQ